MTLSTLFPDSCLGGVCGGVVDGAEGVDVAAEGQDLLAVEGALLHPDRGLPAGLQEGHQPHHRDGRLHLQDQTRRGRGGLLAGLGFVTTLVIGLLPYDKYWIL